MKSQFDFEANQPSTVFDSLHSLPKYYGAKFFILIDKMCNVFTELAAGMVQGTDSTFNSYPESELEINLKNSKAFKSWHRSMEDLIDETGEQFRSKLSELSQIYASISSESKEVKSYMNNFIHQLHLRSSGRQQKKTAEALNDLARIIESSNILDAADLEGSRMMKTARKNLAGSGDEESNTVGGGSSKIPYKDSDGRDPGRDAKEVPFKPANQPKKEEVIQLNSNRQDQKSTDTFREASPVKEVEKVKPKVKTMADGPGKKQTSEDDGQLIKNVRITKGIIASQSIHFSFRLFVPYRVELQQRLRSGGRKRSPTNKMDL